MAFYSDKASVFRSNHTEPQGGDGVTQFGRALDDLNIDIICANSAPAKGRVERANSTLQDRLVKELRLRGISSVDAANAFALEFVADYNTRFAKAPKNPFNAHRAVLPSEVLDEIFVCASRSRVAGASRESHVEPHDESIGMGHTGRGMASEREDRQGLLQGQRLQGGAAAVVV